MTAGVWTIAHVPSHTTEDGHTHTYFVLSQMPRQTNNGIEVYFQGLFSAVCGMQHFEGFSSKKIVFGPRMSTQTHSVAHVHLLLRQSEQIYASASQMNT
jgi:hypothetical protein